MKNTMSRSICSFLFSYFMGFIFGAKQLQTMTIKQIATKTWDYFKVDDPHKFPQEYSDATVNRERKPKREVKTKLAQLYEVFSWYPSYYSAYERRFLLKVDICVLIFMALNFYTKYLDSSNISNAYVSGMKEELGLWGNELNYFTTFFNIGYCIFQIPLVFLIQKQKFARYLLIACELCWGICTISASTAQNAKQLYVVRFFVGVSEAVSFPGAYLVMSTWYTPEELVRRAGFYNMMASVGTATSGLLQTACRENLDGIMGRSGWRWQFIIDGILTLGCTLYGILLFPGIPATTKRFGLLTEDDCLFARRRMANRVSIPKNFSKQTLKNIFFTWQPYMLTLLWCSYNQVNYSSDMQLYLKTKTSKYGESAPTNFAAGGGGVAAASALIVSSLSAVYGKIPVVSAVFVIQLFCNINLLVWNIPDPLKLSAYFLKNVFSFGLPPVFYAWSANLNRDDAEKKAFVFALMNTLAYVTGAWSTPLRWNTKYSPQFKIGYSVGLAMAFLLFLTFYSIWALEKWDYRILPKFTGNRNKFVKDNMDTKMLQNRENTSSIDDVESTAGKKVVDAVAVSVKNLN